MKLLTRFILILSLFSPFISIAEENNLQSAFISDDLFIYMHSGAGKNYRIVGVVNAGDEIKLTGNVANDFTEIVEPKGKIAWVESQYVSQNPSLRNVIAELNAKLASHNENLSHSEQALTEIKNQLTSVQNKNAALVKEKTKLNAELTDIKSKLKDQDQEILTQWFFNGAIVLGIGFLLGIVLPKFAGRKRNSSSWS